MDLGFLPKLQGGQAGGGFNDFIAAALQHSSNQGAKRRFIFDHKYGAFLWLRFHGQIFLIRAPFGKLIRTIGILADGGMPGFVFK